MEALDPLAGVPSSWTERRIEQASFDDFYVMLPAGVPVERWVNDVRTAVHAATGLRCSAGVARTKLLAMLATKRGKPDGMHYCFGRGNTTGTMSVDEQELLDQARVASIRGAGLNGLRPQVRATLTDLLGDSATIEAVRHWADRAPRTPGTGANLLGADDAEALRMMLDRGDDGSKVPKFALPRGLSVERSVRPTDNVPATTVGQIAAGFEELAPLLLSRAEEDAATYGYQHPVKLVVKWKLFPGASKVRQTQTGWPSSIAVGDSLASAVAATATEKFATATRGEPFRVSRVVLALTYVDPDSTASTARSRKRQQLDLAGDRKQRKISDMFPRP